HPLTEPLRTEPWNVPSKEWPTALGIKLPDATTPRERVSHDQSGHGHLCHSIGWIPQRAMQ
ncbi:MAG: hypothetical protein ABGZ17_25880, partial [Planctomycetaceae bacterium]